MSFHCMIISFCQNSLAFGPLYTTVFPKHVEREQDNFQKVMSVLGRLTVYPGKVAASSLLLAFPRGSYCPCFDMTWCLYHVNKLSCLIFDGYIPSIPNTPFKEWEHAWIQDTWV